MRKTFLDKRIPSFLGLLFLAISIGMVSWYGQNYTETLTRAAAGEMPKNVQVSNITDSSFTVSYTTDDATISTLGYGTDESLLQVALDDRDKALNKTSSHRIHYFTFSGLSSGTKYFFGIQSGSSTFLNNGKPYEVTTKVVPLNDQPNQGYTVTGSAHLLDGNIPIEGIAYLSKVDAFQDPTASQAAQLSVLLLPDGSYSFKDLRAFSPIGDTSELKLTVTNGSLESNVSVLAKYANPVPLISLSKDYDFRVASSSAELTPSLAVSGFPLGPTEVASEPAILTPKDAEKFKDAQPLFKGTAIPGGKVEITIQSEQQISMSVQADNFGSWQFRPTVPLDPGEHIITIITQDADGILRTIKRSFTVYAEGSQFADPLVSPVQTPSPTTAKPTTIPTSPTSVPTTPITPTVMPTMTATPTATLIPTLPQSSITPVAVAPTVAPAGSSTVIVGGIVAVVLFIVGGFMLFFL